MKPNKPFYPCQLEDGRTFVMRRDTIVHEVGGFELTDRWRKAQTTADAMNEDARDNRRSWVAIAFLFFGIVVISLGIGLIVRLFQ